jgi:lipopolysaccharide/colanic/teichoic acid biosynthesis glycosyltransferase
LRRTSLDELPQLFNVIRGEMSLVGPRPVIRAELSKYGDDVDYFLMVRPGMTGLWQVSGRNDTSYDTRVYLDTWYVKNWSLWYDIAILFKTIKVVLRRDGAY